MESNLRIKINIVSIPLDKDIITIIIYNHNIKHFINIIQVYKWVINIIRALDIFMETKFSNITIKIILIYQTIKLNINKEIIDYLHKNYHFILPYNINFTIKYYKNGISRNNDRRSLQHIRVLELAFDEPFEPFGWKFEFGSIIES
jgi:hypothetical protein